MRVPETETGAAPEMEQPEHRSRGVEVEMPAGDGAAGGPGARSSEHGAANAAEVEMPKEQVLSLLQVLSLHGAAKLVVRNTPVPNSTPTTLNYVSLYHSKTGVTPA